MGSEASFAAQAEPCIRADRPGAGRDLEGEVVDPGRHGNGHQDLLAGVQPRLVAVEVDPCIQPGGRRRGAAGNRARDPNLGGLARHQGRQEDDAVLVVAVGRIVVIPERVQRGLAVRLPVHHGAESEALEKDVSRAVVAQKRRVLARGIAKVHERGRGLNPDPVVLHLAIPRQARGQQLALAAQAEARVGRPGRRRGRHGEGKVVVAGGDRDRVEDLLACVGPTLVLVVIEPSVHKGR